MATRTLSAFEIKANWPSAWGASGKLVLTLSRSVVSEDGVSYPATANEGAKLSTLGFHWETAITVVGGTGMTTALAGLINTDTATPDHVATYNVYIYDARGIKREQLNAKPYHIHESLNGNAAAFTWEQWVNAMEFVQFRGDNVFVADRATVQAMIDAQANAKAGVSPTYGITALSVAPASPTNPIAVGTNDPRVNHFYNLRTYGAVGDGVTDDAPALRAAIAANEAAGGNGEVFGSGGNFRLTSASGGALATITKNVRLRLTEGAKFIIDSGLGASNYWLLIKPGANYTMDQLTIEGCTFEPSNWANVVGYVGPGNDAIRFDLTNSGSQIRKLRFVGNIVKQGGARSISTILNHDGFFTNNFEDNWLYGPPLLGALTGDSIVWVRNHITGNIVDQAFEVTQHPGSAGLLILDNFISAPGGLILHSGTKPVIHGNTIEVANASLTTPGTAMIRLQGDIGSIQHATIRDNTFVGIIAGCDVLRIDDADSTFFDGNSFNIDVGRNLLNVTGGTNTTVGFNRALQLGGGGGGSLTGAGYTTTDTFFGYIPKIWKQPSNIPDYVQDGHFYVSKQVFSGAGTAGGIWIRRK